MPSMSHDVHVGRYTIREEIASSVLHGIGAVLAIAGLVVLAVFATLRGTVWHIVGCSIFGATLVFLYVSSTLYHSIQAVRAKSVLRAFDHSAIFLLIAGTYTPFTLVSLRGPWGWSLLAAIWSLAVLGIVFRLTLTTKSTALYVVLYVLMGWAVIVAAKPMLQNVATGGLVLLLLGGLTYTAGIIFYGWRKLPYSHAIWHVFVLMASIFHFFAVLMYVIPLAPSARF